ncbi:MAG: ribosomal-processing cysteine protease Prp [Lachnospiraceae bacterium]|nr:ribosomal-processing cysteine protease Prp [Lachnospiraceae bacterium]
MTKVRFYQNDQGEILGFQTIGHAGYAQSGEDIVCAGISALVTNALNSIEKFTNDNQIIECDEDRGIIRMKIKGDRSKEAQLLLKSLYLGLKSIEEVHDRYIKVSFKEV